MESAFLIEIQVIWETDMLMIENKMTENPKHF